jgi:hypothetical protein
MRKKIVFEKTFGMKIRIAHTKWVIVKPFSLSNSNLFLVIQKNNNVFEVKPWIEKN